MKDLLTGSKSRSLAVKDVLVNKRNKTFEP